MLSRLLSFVLAVALAFVAGVVCGVHVPEVSKYVGGQHPTCACPCPCGCCHGKPCTCGDACPCKCGCAKGNACDCCKQK